MAAFIYTAREMFAWLLFFAILFGAVLFVVVAGILLDEGRRFVVLSLKSRSQGLSARMRSSLRPAINPGGRREQSVMTAALPKLLDAGIAGIVPESIAGQTI